MKAIRRKTVGRSGWQLVELSFVLGVFAIITVGATRLIVGLMTIENSSGRELQETAILDRLAAKWRDDLHRATSATVSADSRSLRLDTAPGSHVEYRIDGDTLVRLRSREGKRTPDREAYAVAARRWRFEPSVDGRLMTLVRESAPPGILQHTNAPGPSQTDVFQAAIGLLAASIGDRSQEGGAR